jgi:HK97 family phage major capsid protein
MPEANASADGAVAQPEVATIVKAVKDGLADTYATKDEVATKDDLNTLNKSMNELKQLVKEKDSAAVAYAEPSRYGRLTAFKTADRAYDFGAALALTLYKEAPKLMGDKKLILPETAARLEKHLTNRGYLTKAAQVEGDNALGGFLVMDQFLNDMIDLRETYGVFPQHARVVAMSSDHVKRPRRVSGYTGYFVGEYASITESNATWDMVTLTARKYAHLATISNELNEDGMIDFAENFAKEAAWDTAKMIDLCGFIGDASSTYAGITGVTQKLLGLSATRANIAGLVVGAGNAWSELTLANMHAVAAKLPRYAQARAKWFVSQAFFDGVMHPLLTAAGGNTMMDLSGGAQQRFLGYPVVITQAMPVVEANDTVCALLGDLSLAAMYGTRRGMNFAVSEHTKFAEDAVQVRSTSRWDINVHDVGNESGTAASRIPGPVVGLLTAAS